MTIALITGASSGIGEATARRLAREPDLQLVLVARREERLSALAGELGAGTTYVAADLTDDDAPGRVAAHLREHHGGRLHLLVNNAGAAWRGEFADVGYANVRRTMDLNFDAVVRLTEALLPVLRASAPTAVVNVGSTAGQVARAGSASYSASKFALHGWSDGLHLEEKKHGVHVGVVKPGFIRTEGFPRQSCRAGSSRRPTRSPRPSWTAGAGKAERFVPRPYRLAAVLRVLAPALNRRVLSGDGASRLTTSTGADAGQAEGASVSPE